jgi:hypothetical protein
MKQEFRDLEARRWNRLEEIRQQAVMVSPGNPAP